MFQHKSDEDRRITNYKLLISMKTLFSHHTYITEKNVTIMELT